MRILLVTQVAPFPPDAGPKVKTYFLLKMLAARYEIELVTFARDEREHESARELASICRSVTTVPLHRNKLLEPVYAARAWSRRTPFLVARDHRRKMAEIVERRTRSGEIDVVHADQLSMAQYLPHRRVPHSQVRTVFDAHNAVWKLVQSLAASQPTALHRRAASVEWRMLRRFEGAVCAGSDVTLAVSSIDAHHLRSAAGNRGTYVVAPIGVEVQDVRRIPFVASNRRLLSVATMHYPPNADAIRWFRDAVWPLLSPADRSAGIDIIGNRPPSDLVTWAALDPDVEVHGYVADLEPYFHQTGVFVVPLHAGSGIRVKVLEAMGRGLPVVSTSIGVEGLPVVSGEHLLIADTGQAFANAISRLLHDPQLREQLARSGRAFAEDYDWRTCLRPIADAYSQLDRDPGRAPGQREPLALQVR